MGESEIPGRVEWSSRTRPSSLLAAPLRHLVKKRHRQSGAGPPLWAVGGTSSIRRFSKSETATLPSEHRAPSRPRRPAEQGVWPQIVSFVQGLRGGGGGQRRRDGVPMPRPDARFYLGRAAGEWRGGLEGGDERTDVGPEPHATPQRLLSCSCAAPMSPPHRAPKQSQRRLPVEGLCCSDVPPASDSDTDAPKDGANL